MDKEGYQPIKQKKTIKIIPPNTSNNVQKKKDGYTWEDLDKAWWEGFDNAKNKMEKRIADLEAEVKEWKDKADLWCKTANLKDHNIMINKELEKENAELKKQLEMSNKVYNDNLDYSHHIEGQLTKAKEIIRSLYFIIQGRIDYKGNIPLEDEMYRAEQFLSEVEK